MSTVIDSLEQQAIKPRPRFDAGDRVRVHFQVVEGTRKRTQVFEGIVIKRQGSGARETFTVRKQSFGVGVERTFPLHSPKIEQLEIAARGDVRRAKLYYLRDKVGKQARVAERRWGIEEDVLATEEAPEAVDAEGVSVTEAEPEAVPAEQAEGEADEPKAEEQPAEEPKAEEQPAAETEAGQQPGEEAEAEVSAEGGDERGDEPASEPEAGEPADSEKA